MKWKEAELLWEVMAVLGRVRWDVASAALNFH